MWSCCARIRMSPLSGSSDTPGGATAGPTGRQPAAARAVLFVWFRVKSAFRAELLTEKVICVDFVLKIRIKALSLPCCNTSMYVRVTLNSY